MNKEYEDIEQCLASGAVTFEQRGGLEVMVESEKAQGCKERRVWADYKSVINHSDWMRDGREATWKHHYGHGPLEATNLKIQSGQIKFIPIDENRQAWKISFFNEKTSEWSFAQYVTQVGEGTLTRSMYPTPLKVGDAETIWAAARFVVDNPDSGYSGYRIEGVQL